MHNTTGGVPKSPLGDLGMYKVDKQIVLFKAEGAKSSAIGNARKWRKFRLRDRGKEN